MANRPTAQLRLALLGGVSITLGGNPLPDLRSRKAQALLCYLAVTGRPHSRSALAGLLWSDFPEGNARSNLRKELARLRQVLRPYILATRGEIAFDTDADYWIDVEAFLSRVQPDSDLDRLAEAVTLYSGDFLQDFSLRNAPLYEDWMLIQRAHLREQALLALHSLAAHFNHAGDRPTAIDHIRQLLALEPWREEAHRQLMDLLAREGQRGAALAQYEICRRVLADELDVDPSSETSELYERIRDGTFASELAAPEIVAEPSVRSIAPPAFLSADAPAPLGSTLFVARKRELDVLDTHLDAALNGAGSVLFIAGEAGSGKTALIHEFGRRARERNLVVVDGICNAYVGVGDPYQPWREVLAMLTGDLESKWSAGAITRQQALSLWQILPDVLQTLMQSGPDLLETLVVGKDLLERSSAHPSLGASQYDRLNQLVARRTNSATSRRIEQSHIIEQFTDFLIDLSTKRPLLLLLDDLQWGDLSSISLLFHVGRRIANSRILIVGAYRPEDLLLGMLSGDAEPHPLEELLYEFQGMYGDVALDLSQTVEAEGRAFVDNLLDAKPNRLDETFRRTLFWHTQGHPLFTTELLSDLRERSELFRDMSGHWVEAPTLDWRTLPVQVEGVIGKRIGRLDTVLQQALGVASVEGEDFTAEVVAQVLDLDGHMLVRRLSGELDRRHHLVQAQGVRRLGSQRLSRYRFKHNLFQHYLYNGLDEVERITYHEDVGNALEALHGDQADEISAQLAWHFQRAGIADKAVNYLLRAGRRAVHLSAYQEAIRHLTQGLVQLSMLPETLERNGQELSFQLNLGLSLQTTNGWPAEEVGLAYARADELCVRLGDSERRFRVLWGLQHYHVVRGELHTALELGERHLDLAQRVEDPAQLVAGHFMQAGPLTAMGEFSAARRHWEQGIAQYDRRQHGALANELGSDPGVFCRAWGAHALWSLGYPDQALAMGEEALALAQELSHPFSLVVALDYLAMLHQLRREPNAVCARAEEANAICLEQGFVYYLAWAQILQGWAMAEASEHRRSLRQIRQGLSDLLATGARLREPYYLLLLAEATVKTGQIDECMAILDEAQDAMVRGGERWREAELHRLRGELLMVQGARAEKVEDALRRAVEVARRQRAKSMELRATVSLGHFLCDQGRQETARVVLSEIISWFDEGFDASDFLEAQALVAQTSQVSAP